MPHGSVVVVSYRPGDWLERCLRSVLDQADEVIVVDNGSAGGEATATARRVGARAVTLDRNTGFAGGVNAGVRACRGDVVALLNDDAFAEPGWLAAAVEVLRDPGVGAVAPKLLLEAPHAEVALDDEAKFFPPDGRPLGRQVHSITVDGEEVLPRALGGLHQLEVGSTGEPPWRWSVGPATIYVPLPPGRSDADIRFNGEPVKILDVVDLVNNAGSYLSAHGHGGDFGYETPDRGAFDDAADRFAACGAAMVMRAETIRRVGLLAGRFFAYYEDTDWCWRAQLAGLRIRYDPSAVVRHRRGATSGGPADAWVKDLAVRNRISMLIRNAPLPVAYRELRRAGAAPDWDRARRPVAATAPRALAERLRLSRRWVRTPGDVWEQWAGVNESWPADGRPAPP